MDDNDGRSCVDVLDESACWALLRSVEVGRLAIAIAHDPQIFPVNHVVDHGTLVFRTAEGSKLAGVVDAPVVAYEADGADASTGEVWSVVVRGRADRIRNVHELAATFGLPLFPWQGGRKEHFVRIVPATVTGRRFRKVPDTDRA